MTATAMGCALDPGSGLGLLSGGPEAGQPGAEGDADATTDGGESASPGSGTDDGGTVDDSTDGTAPAGTDGAGAGEVPAETDDGAVGSTGSSAGGDAGRDNTCPAQVVAGPLPFTVQGSTVGGPDAVASDCGGGAVEFTLAFTAPQDGIYAFDTFGSSFDTVLSVIDGDDCSGAELVCNDDTENSLDSQLTIGLLAGDTVVLTVDGAFPSATGSFTLNGALLSDACDGTSLAGALPVSYSGATSGLDQRFGSCGGEGAPEVVLDWTAPAAGDYEITTEGSSFDTLLYVYDGTCFGAEIDCNDDYGGDLISGVVVSLGAGQTIFIVVDGYSEGEEGAFELQINAA